MLKMLAYLLNEKVVTVRDIPLTFSDETRSLPTLTDKVCAAPQCEICQNLCPTDAISAIGVDTKPIVNIDLSKCINCSLCISGCPTGTIVRDNAVGTARAHVNDLLVSTKTTTLAASDDEVNDRSNSISSPPSSASSRPVSNTVSARNNIFKRSIACRVVSTGCSACDLEISACTNPIFDMERFGISIVASPRFADVLIVTGPAPKSMHDALKSCYMAMSEPRKVVALGTCACSGGVHGGGYAEANGVAAILPVDLFIPGCPPHPWSIIEGLVRLMNGNP